MQQTCHLEEAAGRTVACPGERCGFWDDGCAVATLRPDFTTNPVLARFLVGLRRQIEHAAPESSPRESQLLPPGLR